MFTNTITKPNSDSIGATATVLCLIHCIATPLLFIAQTNATHHNHSVPLWWKSIDFIFVAISFFAVFWSVRNTQIQWIKTAFWIAWAALTFVILNEKLELIHLAEAVIYAPALALVSLHIYNRRHCQCKDGDCCSST